MAIHFWRRSGSRESQSALSGASTCCCSAVSFAHAGRTFAFADAALAAGLAAGFFAVSAGGCAAGPGGDREGQEGDQDAPHHSSAGAFFQPVLETAIEVGVDRKVVGEELRVDLHHLGEPLAFLPAIDTERRYDECDRRQQHARGKAAPAPAVAQDVIRPSHHGLGLGALARKRELAGGLQPLGDRALDASLIEDLADAAGEMQFVHGFVRTPAHRVTPRAFNAAANACVAREQCVFTLPSEQPMTCAV